MSDEELNFWADIYCTLNDRLQLKSQHDFQFDQFIENPQLNELFVRLYFANPRLTMSRHNQMRIALTVFLQCEPATFLTTLLHIDAMHAENVYDRRGLLARQQALADLLRRADESEQLQTVIDRQFEQNRHVEHRGTHYREPFYHHETAKKWKTGGHHAIN